MEANSEQGFTPLKITTLGSFDLQLGNQSLLRDTGRSYKLLELFKYFLSFKEKKFYRKQSSISSGLKPIISLQKMHCEPMFLD